MSCLHPAVSSCRIFRDTSLTLPDQTLDEVMRQNSHGLVFSGIIMACICDRSSPKDSLDFKNYPPKALFAVDAIVDVEPMGSCIRYEAL